jgi:hypothetical protein
MACHLTCGIVFCDTGCCYLIVTELHWVILNIPPPARKWGVARQQNFATLWWTGEITSLRTTTCCCHSPVATAYDVSMYRCIAPPPHPTIGPVMEWLWNCGQRTGASRDLICEVLTNTVGRIRRMKPANAEVRHRTLSWASSTKMRPSQTTLLPAFHFRPSKRMFSKVFPTKIKNHVRHVSYPSSVKATYLISILLTLVQVLIWINGVLWPGGTALLNTGSCALQKRPGNSCLNFRWSERRKGKLVLGWRWRDWMTWTGEMSCTVLRRLAWATTILIA